jgi:hypothetical protein
MSFRLSPYTIDIIKRTIVCKRLQSRNEFIEMCAEVFKDGKYIPGEWDNEYRNRMNEMYGKYTSV